MSIAKLSRLSGVPTSTIGNYEHGVMPTLDKADKLLRALGASVAVGKVSALRTQQPPGKLDRSRWEGCDWCIGFCPEVTGDPHWNYKFCPMCGRPLTEEAWAEVEMRINNGTID